MRLINCLENWMRWAMLNILHDITRDALQIPHLRAKIAELTEELHRLEMRIAVHSEQCYHICAEETKK